MSREPAAGGRFAVPDALLRLAEAEESPDAETGAAPAAPAGAAPEPLQATAAPAQVVATLTAGATATASFFAAVRVALPHAEHALHVGDGGAQALLVAAIAGGLAAAPLAGRVADRRGRHRTGTFALLVVAVAGTLAAAAPTVSVLAALLVVVAIAASCQVAADLGCLAGVSAGGPAVRDVAAYATAVPAAATAGVAIATALLAAGGWRAALLVALLAAPAAAIRWRAGFAPPVGTPSEVAVGTTSQRVKRLQSLLAFEAAASVIGFGLVGAPVLCAAFVHDHWHESFARRGHALLAVAIATAVGVAAAAWLGERAPTPKPRGLMRVLGGATSAVGLTIAVAPLLPRAGAEAVWALGAAAAAAAVVLGATAALRVFPGRARSTAFGLLAAHGLVYGGGATVVASALVHADGSRVGLAAAGAATIVAGVVAWAAADRYGDDAAASADQEAGEAGEAPGGRRRRVAALEVRDVDFSYGARQVLFDVGLRVEEGEVAALLGTNGAGKSTLLRLVAGLDHPSSGVIRLWGRDTTYAEAEQQIVNGVALLSGGKMSFPSLTVAENLRVGGHAMRRDGARLRGAIDEVMELFPVLAARRDQRAGTLSGGEQQMLALGRVLLTGPRLLLIDELSLGLAPKAVESLLTIVRRVNEQGTTVLLVEQSVNLALTLARHALFLERGEVRFDGPTAHLLHRSDLLRPIFLGVGN